MTRSGRLVASARAPTLEPMGRFAELLNETLNTEMALHRGYCARFGITEADLEATTLAPSVQAYTDFLVRTAYDGSFSELTCALLPCMWGYCEIGLALTERGKPPDAPIYAEWIDMYATPEFKALADWLRDLANTLAQSQDRQGIQEMEKAYLTSLRYEYLFWESCYNLEVWPI